VTWMRFRHQGEEGFGRIDGDTVAVCGGGLLDAGAPTGERLPTDAIEWLPPFRPGKLIGL
jgi:hypothetical protein